MADARFRDLIRFLRSNPEHKGILGATNLRIIVVMKDWLLLINCENWLYALAPQHLSLKVSGQSEVARWHSGKAKLSGEILRFQIENAGHTKTDKEISYFWK